MLTFGGEEILIASNDSEVYILDANNAENLLGLSGIKQNWPLTEVAQETDSNFAILLMQQKHLHKEQTL